MHCEIHLSKSEHATVGFSKAHKSFWKKSVTDNVLMFVPLRLVHVQMFRASVGSSRTSLSFFYTCYKHTYVSLSSFHIGAFEPNVNNFCMFSVLNMPISHSMMSLDFV